jgi:L-threonylcarbamoyladenylate synthase
MTRTLLLKVDPAALDTSESRASLQQAATLLRGGGTVAFPTETVYGLGANAFDPVAVEKIFTAKQRPSWDPLIVHIAHAELLPTVTSEITGIERMLMDAFWPGPLTLLVPRGDAIPESVTAGRDKVGLRMPAHPVARALIHLAGVPIAAPSANSFGRTSPTTAQHVLEDLDGRIDAIVDGGPTTLGLESTVLDARANPPVIYRPGMVSLEALQRWLPGVVLYKAELKDEAPESLPSPGVGIRHYAPRARLILIEEGQLQSAIEAALQDEGLTGVLLPDKVDGRAPSNPKLRIFPWGDWSNPDQLAQRLFLGLRLLDSEGVVRILCPTPLHGGVGAALRDRLRKAAKPG